MGEIVVSIAPIEVPGTTLEISLLANNLIESVVLIDPNGSNVTLKSNAKIRMGSKNVATKSNDLSLEFVLPANQSEYLYSTLLRTFRDGGLSVSNIHLEGELKSESFDLTFYFKNN